MLLAPSAIEDVVRSIQGLGNEYEVIVDKKGDTDTIMLKVELCEDMTNSAIEALREELATQLRLKTNLGYKLEIFPPASLPRYEMKARRFKDLRKRRYREWRDGFFQRYAQSS